MKKPLTAIACLGAALVSGCVEREMTITSEPEGALVFVSDREMGRTPVTFSFTWYGDYEILCRKKGYEALTTHHRVDPPWYQLPPFDFFAEVLTPWTYEDHHTVEFELEREQLPSRAEIIERALQMRERALYAEE